MHKKAGFTLIEVIVTLIIAGILASIAGMGIVQGIKGYVFAWENAAITQKAELAMARMSLELRDISDVTNTALTTITYIRDSSDHTIAFDGDRGHVTIDSNKIVDQVSGLLMTYKKADGTSWIANDPVKYLARIDIDLILKHTNPDIPGITFTTKINPRNTF